MSTVVINGNEIVTDNLSVKGKLCVASLQILEEYINKTEAEIEICRFAHDTSVDKVRSFLNPKRGAD